MWFSVGVDGVLIIRVIGNGVCRIKVVEGEGLGDVLVFIN